MPSRTVDIAWHEFIVNTVEYDRFCHKAYGSFLHHTPDAAMPSDDAKTLGTQGMATTFALASWDEGLRLPQDVRLPLIFGVDHELGIAGGQKWTLDCGKRECVVEGGTRCVRHELRPLFPDRLPKKYLSDSAKPFYDSQLTGSSSGSRCGSGGGSHGCGGH